MVWGGGVNRARKRALICNHNRMQAPSSLELGKIPRGIRTFFCMTTLITCSPEWGDSTWERQFEGPYRPKSATVQEPGGTPLFLTKLRAHVKNLLTHKKVLVEQRKTRTPHFW